MLSRLVAMHTKAGLFAATHSLQGAPSLRSNAVELVPRTANIENREKMSVFCRYASSPINTYLTSPCKQIAQGQQPSFATYGMFKLASSVYLNPQVGQYKLRQTATWLHMQIVKG